MYDKKKDDFFVSGVWGYSDVKVSRFLIFPFDFISWIITFITNSTSKLCGIRPFTAFEVAILTSISDNRFWTLFRLSK